MKVSGWNESIIKAELYCGGGDMESVFIVSAMAAPCA